MNKIYYKTTNGYLCDRYPLDISHEGDDIAELEVEDEELYNSTFACDYGNTWAVIDGELKEIACPEIQETDEFQHYLKENQYVQAKSFLTNTDFVIAKINEATIEGDGTEVNTLKEKYNDIISQRKLARQYINEYEASEGLSKK